MNVRLLMALFGLPLDAYSDEEIEAAALRFRPGPGAPANFLACFPKRGDDR